jgi:hypothetical protein
MAESKSTCSAFDFNDQPEKSANFDSFPSNRLGADSECAARRAQAFWCFLITHWAARSCGGSIVFDVMPSMTPFACQTHDPFEDTNALADVVSPEAASAVEARGLGAAIARVAIYNG